MFCPHVCVQVEVGKGAFQSEDAVEEEDEDKEASPKMVGHNIFILAKQVCRYTLNRHDVVILTWIVPSVINFTFCLFEYARRQTNISMVKAMFKQLYFSLQWKI